MDFRKIDFKKVKEVSYWVIFGFLLAVLAFVLIPLLPIKNNYSLKMVTSGSMSPTIKTGAIVMIKPTSVYKIGDIITYQVGPSKRDIVTHRIISQNNDGFITQGDANNVADVKPVKKEQILGKVISTVPYAGYIANFGRSKLGFLLLIITPALLIIGDEIRKIFQEAQKIQQKKKEA